MEILNTSTWILILFDVVGVWLLVRPSDLVNVWSAHRVLASDFDRFVARLVGVIMLSAQVTHWVGQAKNTNAGLIMRWLSIIYWVGAVVFLGYHFVGLFGSKPDRRRQVDDSEATLLVTGIGGGIPSSLQGSLAKVSEVASPVSDRISRLASIWFRTRRTVPFI